MKYAVPSFVFMVLVSLAYWGYLMTRETPASWEGANLYDDVASSLYMATPVPRLERAYTVAVGRDGKGHPQFFYHRATNGDLYTISVREWSDGLVETVAFKAERRTAVPSPRATP